MAKHQDTKAMEELKMIRLKKNATQTANEFNSLELNKSDNFRSESREWNSEYDEKYQDYSQTRSRYELYLSEKPNRLTKSTLLASQPLIRGGSESARQRKNNFDV